MKIHTLAIFLGILMISSTITIHDSFAQEGKEVRGQDYPLKQMRAGVSYGDIKCNVNFEKLFKNSKVICVTPETKFKLVERRGWSEHQDPNMQQTPNNIVDKPQLLEQFPYSFEKDVFETLPESISSFNFTSNDIIKFESNEEVFSFLNDARELQKQHSFDSEVLILERRDIAESTLSEPTPEPEPEPAHIPYVERRQIEAGLAHGGLQSFDETQIEYSTTNVQVDLVDEPDYLKTDGKHVYVVNQNTLTIIDAYPPDQAKIVLKAALDIEPQNLENMFLNGDRLAILHYGSSESQAISEFDFVPYPIHIPNTMITLLDIADRQNPILISQHTVDGDYNDSRMIGNVLYLITTNWIDYDNPIIPRVIAETEITHPEIYRFPNPEQNYNFNTVAAIDVLSGNLINSEVFLMGHTNSIYVSLDNLYITYEKTTIPLSFEQFQKDRFFKIVLPLLPQNVQDKIEEINENPSLDSRQKWRQVSIILQEEYNLMSKDTRERLFSEIKKALEEYDSKLDDRRKTVIHKIGLDQGNLAYVANGEVPGHPLNQFSMDEHHGKFRIATTSQSFSDRGDISNNVYVLDEQLELVGQLEEIAPKEQIYSARFMGDKLYLVTFERIDPFFVIDLSDDSPKILGELKIPGFSNYLQAFDEDHIIGIGRDTEENKRGRVQQLGIKIAMFDVSDFNNPKQKDVIIIGDSRTDSEILHDHKALLLDKEKDVMSIPIKTSISSLDEPHDDIQERFYRDRYWHGFYVYGFDVSGFVEKGTITHHQWQDHYNLPYMKPRSFYIEDTLYTLMDGSMKMNDLEDIENEISSLTLGHTGRIIPYLE